MREFPWGWQQLLLLAVLAAAHCTLARAASQCQARFSLEEVGMRLRGMDGYADRALLIDADADIDASVWALDFVDIGGQGEADGADYGDAGRALADCNCTLTFSSLVCSRAKETRVPRCQFPCRR